MSYELILSKILRSLFEVLSLEYDRLPVNRLIERDRVASAGHHPDLHRLESHAAVVTHHHVAFLTITQLLMMAGHACVKCGTDASVHRLHHEKGDRLAVRGISKKVRLAVFNSRERYANVPPLALYGRRFRQPDGRIAQGREHGPIAHFLFHIHAFCQPKRTERKDNRRRDRQRLDPGFFPLAHHARFFVAQRATSGNVRATGLAIFSVFAQQCSTLTAPTHTFLSFLTFQLCSRLDTGGSRLFPHP